METARPEEQPRRTPVDAAPHPSSPRRRDRSGLRSPWSGTMPYGPAIPARRAARWPAGWQLVQTPVRHDGQPEPITGVPVPVLDETGETFWWDIGNYYMLRAANPSKPGGPWYYAFARTLPGFPTLTQDVNARLSQ